MRVAILDDEPAELRRVEQTLRQIPARLNSLGRCIFSNVVKTCCASYAGKPLTC